MLIVICIHIYAVISYKGSSITLIKYLIFLQHNEAVHNLYESLRDKVGSHSTEDQLASTVQMDTLGLDCSSPALTGIPTPTSSTCPLQEFLIKK